MNLSHEVEQMVCVAKGPKHGPAPIPQEGAWTKAKDLGWYFCCEMDRIAKACYQVLRAKWNSNKHRG